MFAFLSRDCSRKTTSEHLSFIGFEVKRLILSMDDIEEIFSINETDNLLIKERKKFDIDVVFL